MAIAKCVRILVRAIADGESAQFTFDLANDPYWVGTDTAAGMGGSLINWMLDPERTPSDILVVGGAQGANLSGDGSTLILIDVPVKPVGYVYEVVLDAIFY